jgi:diguanylate cyclase
MRLRVTTWRHVFIYSAMVTALAVAVPVIIVAIFLFPIPMYFKVPVLMISGLIPLFITMPISVFALHMLKLVNQTVVTLDELVKFDNLTGLLSRGHFLHLLDIRRKKGGYLAIIDADHFKKVNDTYGHDAGDKALQHLAGIVAQVVGNQGLVGRMGGEEFAFYLPAVRLDQARLISSSVCAALRSQAFDYNGVLICLTASIGLVADDGQGFVAPVLRRADLCLYAAKHRGRDQYVLEEVLDERAQSAA